MSDRPKVILASGNAGKAREFERLLGGFLEVRAVPEGIALPNETGTTFQENARLKAESVFATLEGRVPVLADDSGLEVDALDCEPGVHSARYAGEKATDHDNVTRLLKDLGETEERGARFVCELCLLLPATAVKAGPTVVEARGEAQGTIEREPRGDDGFGYDPVFRPLGWTRTLAEAAPHDKDAVSHRGTAARVLLAALEERGLMTHER